VECVWVKLVKQIPNWNHCISCDCHN